LMIASCLVITAMCWMTGGPASPYYAGINLTILVVIFVMILDARRVMVACGIVYAAFMLPLAFGPAQASTVVANNFFLITTMALAVTWTLLKNRNRLESLKSRRRLALANEELKRLDRMKSQFFANISHEVRTPLTSIISPIESFHQGDAGPLTAEQHILIESMYRNSLKLLDLINQMLDFAKIEAGKMPLRLALADPADTLKEIVSNLQPIAGRKGLSLEFHKEGEIPAVYIDEEKFERIATNLVRNALKFTEHGSIGLTLKLDRPWVVLVVEDTGIGIAPEHLASIFERFQQVDGSSTRHYEGTGLGLTLVKEYVELMLGRISVTSEAEHGTRFRVEIPANLNELAPKAFVERREGGSGRLLLGDFRRSLMRRRNDVGRISLEDLNRIEQAGEAIPVFGGPTDAAGKAETRVLLVEDNADLRVFIQAMLVKLGHDVAAVSDGLEALKAVEDKPPDAIVSDIMMPKMDGYELLRKIKAAPHTRQIPVILITAKPELEARLKGYEGGADAYLNKPINIRELDARIRNLAAQRRLQRAAIRMRDMEAREDERRRGYEKLRQALKSTVQAFASVVEMKDPYTAGHQKRMADLARALGAAMGFTEDRCEGLHTAGMIHDIGKIRIPGEILNKTSKLTPLEFDLVKVHAQAGADLLKGIDFPWPIARMILEHHERLDGSGYPNGLTGEDLLPESKILAVANVVEAICSHRPHRPALGIEAALEEITSNRGSFYDPDAVDACLRLFRENGYVLPS
ncbi:MAG: response regulator, partial [Candidatus Aminicenantes bacterium]|nr:response regulator [Candidatus Aminicenantes bacterium]